MIMTNHLEWELLIVMKDLKQENDWKSHHMAIPTVLWIRHTVLFVKEILRVWNHIWNQADTIRKNSECLLKSCWMRTMNNRGFFFNIFLLTFSEKTNDCTSCTFEYASFDIFRIKIGRYIHEKLTRDLECSLVTHVSWRGVMWCDLLSWMFPHCVCIWVYCLFSECCLYVCVCRPCAWWPVLCLCCLCVSITGFCWKSDVAFGRCLYACQKFVEQFLVHGE